MGIEVRGKGLVLTGAIGREIRERESIVLDLIFHAGLGSVCIYGRTFSNPVTESQGSFAFLYAPPPFAAHPDPLLTWGAVKTYPGLQ